MKTLHVETHNKIFSYKDDETVTHHYEIGHANGVLLITTKKKVSETFDSVTDDEVVKAYSPDSGWSVWYTGEDG